MRLDRRPRRRHRCSPACAGRSRWPPPVGCADGIILTELTGPSAVRDSLATRSADRAVRSRRLHRRLDRRRPSGRQAGDRPVHRRERRPRVELRPAVGAVPRRPRRPRQGRWRRRHRLGPRRLVDRARRDRHPRRRRRPRRRPSAPPERRPCRSSRHRSPTRPSPRSTASRETSSRRSDCNESAQAGGGFVAWRHEPGVDAGFVAGTTRQAATGMARQRPAAQRVEDARRVPAARVRRRGPFVAGVARPGRRRRRLPAPGRRLRRELRGVLRRQHPREAAASSCRWRS